MAVSATHGIVAAEHMSGVRAYGRVAHSMTVAKRPTVTKPACSYALIAAVL